MATNHLLAHAHSWAPLHQGTTTPIGPMPPNMVANPVGVEASSLSEAELNPKIELTQGKID